MECFRENNPQPRSLFLRIPINLQIALYNAHSLHSLHMYAHARNIAGLMFFLARPDNNV